MDETLLTFAREELLAKIGEAEERIWLVTPFLTAPIAVRIADAAVRSSAERGEFETLVRAMLSGFSP